MKKMSQPRANKESTATNTRKPSQEVTKDLYIGQSSQKNFGKFGIEHEQVQSNNLRNIHSGIFGKKPALPKYFSHQTVNLEPKVYKSISPSTQALQIKTLSSQEVIYYSPRIPEPNPENNRLHGHTRVYSYIPASQDKQDFNRVPYVSQ
jgi:hypothetical protein